MRAITATVTPAAPTAMVRMDNFATAVLGGAIAVLGGAAFTLQHSCDDPNDLVSPVALGSMFWDTSLLPTAAQGGSANVTFEIMASPLWFLLDPHKRHRGRQGHLPSGGRTQPLQYLQGAVRASPPR